MSTENEQLVTAFCQTLQDGDIDQLLGYLHEDVVYQNMPWKPVNGHEGVRKVLTPFLGSGKCAITNMEIHHTTSSGNVVMNERSETWEAGEVRLVLLVAGVFELDNGKITRWRDYFDGVAMKPLMDVVI